MNQATNRASKCEVHSCKTHSNELSLLEIVAVLLEVSISIVNSSCSKGGGPFHEGLVEFALVSFEPAEL